MTLEETMKLIILVVGWPTLIIFSLLIANEGFKFYSKLKKTVIGSLMLPSVAVLMFGLFSLGIVSTAYMLDQTWYYFVLPVFGLFMVAIMVMFQSMKKWGDQAVELQSFYENLEVLVAKKTSELKQAHENEIKHEKEIQKLKDQFVFIAAHELRTPVTAIRWAIETALGEGGKIDQDLKESLDTVQESNSRLIKLIDDILNIARIESGTISMDYSVFELKKVIEETLREMKSVFDEKNIKIHADIEEIKVKSDPERVKQILINLLSNATKYNKENGEIWIGIQQNDEGIVISVKDTGFGIAVEDMNTLFTQFGRVQSNETKNIPGTGLGLFLCKQIVEQWGGKIYAESELNQGSTFSFTIPNEPKEITNKSEESDQQIEK